MTIPASVVLPTPPTDPKQVPDYLRRLNVAIQSQYGQVAAAVNRESGLTNLDGGTAGAVYTATQHVDGGGA